MTHNQLYSTTMSCHGYVSLPMALLHGQDALLLLLLGRRHQLVVGRQIVQGVGHLLRGVILRVLPGVSRRKFTVHRLYGLRVGILCGKKSG
jgi:hypothetical protein